MDPALRLLQATPWASRTRGDDLRKDRHSGLGRSLSTDVEPCGPGDAIDLLGLETFLEQPLASALLCSPRADRADIERVAAEGSCECRAVESLLMREHDNGGALVRLHAGEHVLRPRDDDLVRARDALGRCEGGTRVSDQGLPTKPERSGAERPAMSTAPNTSKRHGRSS